MLTLTAMEKIVLKALIISSDSNGHDFGFVEDARGSVPIASLGGVVASLVTKGIVRVYPPEVTDSGRWTQVVIPSVRDAHDSDVAADALLRVCATDTPDLSAVVPYMIKALQDAAAVLSATGLEGRDQLQEVLQQIEEVLKKVDES